MAHFSLTDLKEYLSTDSTRTYWMGIDVHKRSYYMALLDGEDNTFSWSGPADNEKLLTLINDMGIRLEGVCYEAGPTGFSLARILQGAGIPVIVAAPNKIPRSVSPGSKTDRLDCLKLARLASKGLIKPIAVPTEEEEAERALLRRRHQLTDEIRRGKQRIKALFLYHGYQIPASVVVWNRESIKDLKSQTLPLEVKMTLESHVRELEFHNEELSTVMKQLRDIGKKPEHRKKLEALKSVPGVGEVVATTFLLELFRPRRFRRSEEVTSYLGLAPTVQQSGERAPRGRLVPVGQKRLRSLLIEAAWIWQSRDEYAHRLYAKLVSKSGVPQKAITALARKLSIILWRLSLEQRAYRPQLI